MVSYVKIFACLQEIYGKKLLEVHRTRLCEIFKAFKIVNLPTVQEGLSESDSILITYGDAIQSKDGSALQALGKFLDKYIGDSISSVHLLPFFPYSSDDGFSVIDFCEVDPDLGTWADIADLKKSYDLMFDAVINHVSVESEWFQNFLTGKDPFLQYFITVPEDVDLREVTRPRALPLLTTFNTSEGPKQVWTTFSTDQVDLNYHNPDVLIDIVRILLMFVARGARFIRLDAIAYIWKEIGTSCIHHDNVHRIVQFFRLIFDELAPYVQIITETNVPHNENLSYFGDGTNEAQLVYNFSLPPLVLHAFHRKNASTLTSWANNLKLPSKRTTFFNFLASHDGIGLTPAVGLIPNNEIDELCERITELGGWVSYKDNSDGSRSPYELNINYLDGLGDPAKKKETQTLVVDRFLASQSIMLAIKGIPGIYYHSLLGSRSWPEGVRITGRNRTINRKKLNLEDLNIELGQDDSLRNQVLEGYLSLLRTRAFMAGAGFSPLGEQTVLDLDDRLFCVMREAPDHHKKVICVTNVSPEPITAVIHKWYLSLQIVEDWEPILVRNAVSRLKDGELSIVLGAYGVLWLLCRYD
jgi:glucosylglycerate phosphorylase